MFCDMTHPSYSEEMSKGEVANLIRKIADDSESFENAVFELGVTVLAKEFLKKKKRIARNISKTKKFNTGITLIRYRDGDKLYLHAFKIDDNLDVAWKENFLIEHLLDDRMQVTEQTLKEEAQWKDKADFLHVPSQTPSSKE